MNRRTCLARCVLRWYRVCDDPPPSPSSHGWWTVRRTVKFTKPLLGSMLHVCIHKSVYSSLLSKNKHSNPTDCRTQLPPPPINHEFCSFVDSESILPFPQLSLLSVTMASPAPKMKTKNKAPPSRQDHQQKQQQQQQQQQEEDEELLQELLEHNAFFDRLVDMIPSKLYIAGQSGDDWNPKHHRDNKNNNTTSKKNDNSSGSGNGSTKYYHTKDPAPDTKEARRAAAKEAKRRKLDPSRSESTSQLKARLDEEEQNAPRRSLLPTRPADASGAAANKNHTATSKKQPKTPAAPQTDSISPSSPPKSSSTAATSTAVVSDKADPSPSAAATDPAGTAPPSVDRSRIETLRSKLQAKLAALTGDRPPPDQVSKRAARRAERVRRRQLSTNAASHSSKSSGTTATTTAAAVKRPAWTVPPPGTAAAAMPVSPQLPVVEPAALGFGRLIGLHDPATNPHPTLADNKSLSHLNKTKNLKKLVADAEAKREQLERWKRSADESDKQRARDAQWADALSEAAGRRVKDDPAKLKKALKQRVAKKAKSQKAWQSRLESVAASKDARQQERTQNLQARRNRKLGLPTEPASKVKPEEGASKGNGSRRLSRAGFEGRKQDFLNGDRSGGKKKN